MKQLILLTALLAGLLCFNQSAYCVVAYGQVSANVVAMSSVSFTGNLVLKDIINQTDNNKMALSTLNHENTAKLIINSSYDATYSITVAPTAQYTRENKRYVLVRDLKINNNVNKDSAKGGQSIQLTGVTDQNYDFEAGRYNASTEITVNYN